LALALGTVPVWCATAGAADDPNLNKIETVVVIYAENRSFDNLYGHFPGANGLQNVTPDMVRQLDRDGTPLKELPPTWGGLTAPGVVPPVTQAQTEHLPNALFAIDDPKGFNQALTVTTKDLWHRFYQNQMQINGGKNNDFVAYADAGGLVMGYYDGSRLPLWNIAKRYVLADNFFTGAFGGSFLNHFVMICSCAPYYPNADQSPAKTLISAVEQDGVTLKIADNSPKSAMDGIPKFVNDGNLTPDFYGVNTMQPPYQPSANPPAPGGDPHFADPSKTTTLVPQTMKNIGDLLNEKGVRWVWYAGAWQAALDGQNSAPIPNFQYHHQPFNYFANMAPGTANRAEHLKDAGLWGSEFLKAVDEGTLPPVTFYKPQGNLNEHPGYTDALSGDEHLANVIAHLERSPQWAHMLVVLTYDENGGFWDHAAPPKGDRWGPASRIPALIISPYARRGTVDHTLYDTTSITRFITHRFDLPVLDGIKARDDAMKAAGGTTLGDLTGALDLSK
jgi:phospholipase C